MGPGFTFSCLPLLAAAQPAGGGPFNPEDYGTVELWLDASQLALSNNDPVATWTAVIGDSPTQATSGSQPVFKTGILNGLPVVRFDGTDDFIQNDDPPAFTTEVTMFVVFTPSDTEYTVVQTSNLDAYWRFAGTGDGYWGSFVVPRIEAFPAAMPSSGNRIVAQIQTATTTEIYLDGVSKGSSASTILISDPGNHFRLSGELHPFTGDVAEVIVYSETLSGGDVDTINAALAAKWGISI